MWDCVYCTFCNENDNKRRCGVCNERRPWFPTTIGTKCNSAKNDCESLSSSSSSSKKIGVDKQQQQQKSIPLSSLHEDMTKNCEIVCGRITKQKNHNSKDDIMEQKQNEGKRKRRNKKQNMTVHRKSPTMTISKISQSCFCNRDEQPTESSVEKKFASDTDNAFATPSECVPSYDHFRKQIAECDQIDSASKKVDVNCYSSNIVLTKSTCLSLDECQSIEIWCCDICTLENPKTRRRCSACCSRRQQQQKSSQSSPATNSAIRCIVSSKSVICGITDNKNETSEMTPVASWLARRGGMQRTRKRKRPPFMKSSSSDLDSKEYTVYISLMECQEQKIPDDDELIFPKLAMLPSLVAVMPSIGPPVVTRHENGKTKSARDLIQINRDKIEDPLTNKATLRFDGAVFITQQNNPANLKSAVCDNQITKSIKDNEKNRANILEILLEDLSPKKCFIDEVIVTTKGSRMQEKLDTTKENDFTNVQPTYESFVNCGSRNHVSEVELSIAANEPTIAHATISNEVVTTSDDNIKTDASLNLVSVHDHLTQKIVISERIESKFRINESNQSCSNSRIGRLRPSSIKNSFFYTQETQSQEEMESLKNHSVQDDGAQHCTEKLDVMLTKHDGDASTAEDSGFDQSVSIQSSFYLHDNKDCMQGSLPLRHTNNCCHESNMLASKQHRSHQGDLHATRKKKEIIVSEHELHREKKMLPSASRQATDNTTHPTGHNSTLTAGEDVSIPDTTINRQASAIAAFPVASFQTAGTGSIIDVSDASLANANKILSKHSEGYNAMTLATTSTANGNQLNKNSSGSTLRDENICYRSSDISSEQREKSSPVDYHPVSFYDTRKMKEIIVSEHEMNQPKLLSINPGQIIDNLACPSAFSSSLKTLENLALSSIPVTKQSSTNTTFPGATFKTAGTGSFISISDAGLAFANQLLSPQNEVNDTSILATMKNTSNDYKLDVNTSWRTRPQNPNQVCISQSKRRQVASSMINAPQFCIDITATSPLWQSAESLDASFFESIQVHETVSLHTTGRDKPITVTDDDIGKAVPLFAYKAVSKDDIAHESDIGATVAASGQFSTTNSMLASTTPTVSELEKVAVVTSLKTNRKFGLDTGTMQSTTVDAFGTMWATPDTRKTKSRRVSFSADHFRRQQEFQIVHSASPSNIKQRNSVVACKYTLSDRGSDGTMEMSCSEEKFSDSLDVVSGKENVEPNNSATVATLNIELERFQQTRSRKDLEDTYSEIKIATKLFGDENLLNESVAKQMSRTHCPAPPFRLAGSKETIAVSDIATDFAASLFDDGDPNAICKENGMNNEQPDSKVSYDPVFHLAGSRTKVMIADTAVEYYSKLFEEDNETKPDKKLNIINSESVTKTDLGMGFSLAGSGISVPISDAATEFAAKLFSDENVTEIVQPISMTSWSPGFQLAGSGTKVVISDASTEFALNLLQDDPRVYNELSKSMNLDELPLTKLSKTLVVCAPDASSKDENVLPERMTSGDQELQMLNSTTYVPLTGLRNMGLYDSALNHQDNLFNSRRHELDALVFADEQPAKSTTGDVHRPSPNFLGSTLPVVQHVAAAVTPSISTWISSHSQYLQHGGSKLVGTINSENAFQVIFDIKSGHPVQFGTDTAVETQIKSIRCHLGSDDYANAKITDKWICNHCRWLVWKFASIERCLLLSSGHCFLSFERLLKHLRQRFTKEFQQGLRSSIRKLLNLDVAASLVMILCVARISVDQTTNENQVDGQHHRFVVELTDGWYSIRAYPDSKLCNFIETSKIRVGMKLCISNAIMMDNPNGVDPLDDVYDVNNTSSPYLTFHTNSTRIARRDSRLGFVRPSCNISCPQEIFCIRSLLDVFDDGGPLPFVIVNIVSVSSMLYLDRNNRGKGRILTVAEETERVTQLQKRQQLVFDKNLDDIQKECMEVSF
jgi:BRCA2, oligonucleotide/oligosaccharide-binding, domain 1/BRCA2, helical